MSELRIGIDASAAATPRRSGVGRYIRELVRTLERLDPAERLTVCYRLSRWRKREHWISLEGDRLETRVILGRFAPFLSRRLDLFHGADVRLPRWGRPRMVATIHDLFSLQSEAFARPSFRERRAAAYRRTARTADGVICHSRTVATAVVDLLDVDPEHVAVVPLAAGEEFREPDAPEVARVRAAHDLPEAYVLHVGAVSRRKNVAGLARAVARAAGGGTDLHLVVAGSDGWGAEEEWTGARETLGPRVRRLGYVDRADLPGLYAGAVCLGLLSRNEGFGLPVLEAMRCGTPVVASRAGSLPEVAGEAAALVAPDDVAGAGEAIAGLLDPGRRGEAVEAGRERAAAFSWERTARGTLEVYRAVADGRPPGPPSA